MAEAEGNVMKDAYEYSSQTDDEDDVLCEIIFDASVYDMSEFNTFLEMYKPTVVKRSDSIGLISVKGPKYYDHYAPHQSHGPTCQNPALPELLEDWGAMQANCRVITSNAILEMAKKHNCLGGKWLFVKETGVKIDRAWAAVARAVALGQCGIVASVRPTDDREGGYEGWNMVWVYDRDFTNLEAVEKLERDIRKAGIKCCIAYKPDVYTYLDIYCNNEWCIQPTIYHSQFDILSGKSKIVATFGKEVHRNLKIGQFNHGKQIPTASWRDRSTQDMHQSN